MPKYRFRNSETGEPLEVDASSPRHALQRLESVMVRGNALLVESIFGDDAGNRYLCTENDVVLATDEALLEQLALIDEKLGLLN